MIDFKTATTEELYATGKDIGGGMENSWQSIAKRQLLETGNVSDAVDETIECLGEESSEAWACYSSVSPWEFYAKDLNQRDDSDAAWDALLDGFDNGYSESLENLRDDIKEYLSEELNDMALNQLNIDVPEWIDQDITGIDIKAISEGGCASGAYMPAVTYHTANETMSTHGDDVLDYITDNLGELPALQDQESWSGIAVFYLSIAVELWAHDTADQLESLAE